MPAALDASFAVPALPPAAEKTGGGSFYRPELDALRFVAFLMVFVHHMLPHDPHSYVHGQPTKAALLLAHVASALGAGLPLFFALSAYLLTVLLLREKRRSGTVHMKAFYVRRMLRIWPLYFLAIGLGWLGAVFIAHDHRPGLFIAYLLMAGNWVRQLGLAARTPFEIGHLWSISVEEQFYLLFPAVVRFASRRVLALFAAAIAGVSVLVLIVLASHGTPIETIWRNSFVQFLMFAAGIGLGLYTDRHGLPSLSDLKRACFAALAFALFFGVEIGTNAMTGVEPLPSAGGFVLWFVALAAGCGLLLFATLGLRHTLPGWLVYLGKISYGLYVFHAWGLSGATALLAHLGRHRSLALKDALAFAITVALAMISYTFYEKPFLRLKDRFAFVHSRPV